MGFPPKAGFRVTVISLALLVGYEVLGETSNRSSGVCSMVIYILKFSTGYVLLIQRHIKLTLYFGTGSLCIPKKANKFRVYL